MRAIAVGAAFAIFSLVVINHATAGFITHDGHWYGYTSTASDWQTAENEAQSLGGRLVAINSLAEQQFIESSLLIGAFETVPLWIGLTDQVSEGDFSWSNGELLTYQNWKPGEPNNFGGNEDFVTINWEFARGSGPKGTWNDVPLAGSTGFGGLTDGPYFGIIELTFDPDAAAVPEPSTFALFSIGGLTMCRLTRRRRMPGC